MLMSSVVVDVRICGQKGRQRGGMGAEQGTKNRAVDFECGASKGRSLQLRSKNHHSKEEGYLFTSVNATHAINIIV
jgi:hypothetical protein